jgi:hypothetical protein
MPTSFIDLTNRLLRRLNEATVDESDFSSVRNVQAMAKDIINAACQEITESEFEWPFNATSTTQLLVVGQEDYSWPAGFMIPKWDSFHVIKSVPLNVYGHPLEFISRDLWIKKLKAIDDYSGATGINVPRYVTEKHGEGFTISPSPERAYTVSYEYFAGHTDLTTYDSVSTIPTRFDEVIIQCALYHFYMFRDNSQQASDAQSKYGKLLQNMRTLLINKDDRVRSTMLVRRWGPWQDFFDPEDS